MLRFLVRRIAQMVLVLFIFVTVTFFVLHAMPGDFTHIYAGNPKITPEVLASIRARFGLDQPLGVQYWRFLKSMVTGGMGVSYSHYPQTVWEVLKERIPRTVVLFLSSTIVSFYIGFVLGKVIAWRRGKTVDVVATAAGIGFYTAFYPLVAFICIWLFAFALDWLPLSGFVDPDLWRDAPVTGRTVFSYMIYTGLALAAAMFVSWRAAQACDASRKAKRAIFWGGTGAAVTVALVSWGLSGYGTYALDILHHIILPVAVLSLVNCGGSMLLTRDSMLETISEDYVTAARAKGLPERAIRDRHAARTALLPVVTSLTLSLGTAIGGGVITETLFSWPGLGLTLLDSSLAGDYPLAVGAFTFTGFFILVAHLVADVLNAVLDPRLRTGRGLVH